MDSKLASQVERLIEEKTGQPAQIRDGSRSGGGCINDAQRIVLEDGRDFFLKSNPRPLPGMFPREAEALEKMAEVNAIRVPHPVGAGGEERGETPFILMEYIPTGSAKSGFHESFGRQFAQFHIQSKSDRFGFDHDNYLGSTPQPNGWEDDWVEFWRKHRLGFQLDLARRNGLSDPTMDRLGEKLMDRLPELIAEPAEPSCLLHGDLWGGNYLSDDKGEPVLIDPAAYYGRREADLAMTMLFGGFNSTFYSAYEEVWPLEDGSRDRLEIYKLHHLLNHLNLFGGGYYSGCVSILRRYAG
ncbi:MAG: fructosamine kinase family protein [Candidatus Omnitrophica bacterium]|nr:fructosamine kinase family protein [Candidatus Omnitrophota bacterium]